MRCPFCHHDDTAVKDSRTSDEHIRRRRSCGQCGGRFTTFERVQLRELTVIKKDGRRLPFDREKLTRSILTAVHKNSLPPEKIERIVSSIVRQLETEGDTDISSQKIGQLIMDALKVLDSVAYVRFSSIYHEFQSLEDFIALIQNVSETSKEDKATTESELSSTITRP